MDALRPALTNFLERIQGIAADVQVDARPLGGGLESPVLRVDVRFTDSRGAPRRRVLVAKLLEGAAAREARVYERVVATAAPDFSPRLLGAEWLGADRCLLLLERVRRAAAWPWRDTEAAGRLLARLARLHAARDAHGALADWDYEAELAASAASTIELFAAARPRLGPLARRLPAARRVAEALPRIRAALLGFAPLDRAALHGDVHPGNAFIARRGRRHVPLLIDWARARVGSPLEDVSSWLHSLGFWEPEARRRHDTLLSGYLGERGLPARLDSAVREAYWLAGACNAFAGALRYHLWRAAGEDADPGACAAAADWLRVVRRADAIWR